MHSSHDLVATQGRTPEVTESSLVCQWTLHLIFISRSDLVNKTDDNAMLLAVLLLLTFSDL